MMLRSLNEICCPILTSRLSGSPIIQNGKLVGAVTHVMVANPTEGYGLFIENIIFVITLQAFDARIIM